MSDTTHFRWKDDLLILQVRVTPKSARDQVREVSGDRLKIAITAAPTDGKANRHLIKWLADRFGVPAMRVSITSGLGARDKTVCVERPGKLPAEFHVTRPGPAS